MLKFVQQLVRLWIALSLMLLVFPLGAQGGSGTADDQKKEIPEGFQLMPRMGASIEYGGFIVQQDNYTSCLRRQLEFDVLQYRRHILYLNFNERNLFGTPFNKWDFNLLKYDVVLGGYRYDFGDYYLGIFAHHQCNNPMHRINYHVLTDRERASFYDIGLEFLTKNMRLGMKDRGINFDSPKNFEFLGRFAGGLQASRVLSKQNINLDWLVKGQIRCDLLRYYYLVPYIEVTGDLVAGSVTRLAPAVEVGARCHLANVDFTPFFKWSRDQEALTVAFNPEIYSFNAKNALLGGARLEVLLDADTFHKTQDPRGWQWFPEIHGAAAYGLHLNSPYFNGCGNLELDFEVLRWTPWTLFCYTNMNFDTRKEDFKPDKVNYGLQYGLTYAWSRYFIEGVVKNNQRVDSFFFRGTMERSNLAGLRAGTSGMKPGHYNDGISFEGPKTFQWLNNWQAQGVVGHYFNNRDWQYLWNINAQLRWDPLRWYFIVPYIQSELNWMAGGGATPDALEYSVEPGLRFHGVLDLAFYYRFQHRQNVLFFRGPSANESLVGVRGMF